MTDDRYNGYSNRETWAFNLHWQNDQDLYNDTLEQSRSYVDEFTTDPDSPLEGIHDRNLGEAVVAYWRDTIDGYEAGEMGPVPLPSSLRMMDREVGSWWRIDYAEVGAAVRESLDAES